MKKRLLFVIENRTFGGGERGFLQIINGLPSAKYEIFVASRPGKQFYDAIHKTHKTRVHIIPLTFSKGISLSLILTLIKIIKHYKINIVHGQGAKAEFYSRLANKLARRSSYLSTIQMPVEGFDVGFIRKNVYCFFDRFSERFVDRFLVVSDPLKNTMIREHGIPPQRVVKIYNGIEIDHYAPAKENKEKIRSEFNVSEEMVLIGAVGRLVWQKGFEYLIRCIPEILLTDLKAKILVVGDGPLRVELQKLAERLEVMEHLAFAGFRTDIKEILSAIDILAIPSLLEGFPMITLEGMAMAKPIVATKIDGITEQIIDGESGILILPRDPKAIANAVIQLARDRELARNLGLGARSRVKREFTVDKMVAETEKVYQSLYGQQALMP